MDKKKYQAMEQILRDLHFNQKQIDLMGKIYGFEEEKDLVQKIERSYTNTSFLGKPIIELNEPRAIDISVILQPSLKKEEHETIKRRISEALEKRELPTENFFSYCNKSFGYEAEQENINIHFSIGRQ